MTSTTDDVSYGRQVLRRQINGRMRHAVELPETEPLEIFCECGRRLCAARVRVEAGFYGRAVASGRLYVIAKGHQDAGDAIVGAYDGFFVLDRGLGLD
jgi:hypothetical protein